jgi:protein-S-isoprenylcysteine O-methyltransferase Ste14
VPELALALYTVYLGLAFGLRTLIQLRRTGSTGFHGVGGNPGSPEWLAGVGFAVALVLGATAPVLAQVDILEPIDVLNSHAGHVVGAALAAAGIAVTFAAQVAMGASWRIGVDHSERAALVTRGPFPVRA